MANCPKCGKEIIDGSNFCPNCGAKTTSKKNSKHKTTAILAVLISIAVLSSIFFYFKHKNNLVEIEEPAPIEELSGLYLGLEGSSHKCIYFMPTPNEEEIGFYIEVSDFSNILPDGDEFYFTGSYHFLGTSTVLYSDSILEMQTAFDNLGETPEKYDGSVYTVFGNYLFNEKDIIPGNIPNLKQFNASCSDEEVTYDFKKDGTYTRSYADKVIEGKYVRNGVLLCLYANDSDTTQEYLIYKGGISPHVWKKSHNPKADMDVINRLSSEEINMNEKAVGVVSNTITSTIKKSMSKSFVGNMSIEFDEKVKCENNLIVLGHIYFDIKVGSNIENACFPFNYQLNFSSGDVSLHLYKDNFTVNGLSIEKYKELNQ